MIYLNFATRAANRHERSRQWQAATHVSHAELDDDREASIRSCDLGDVRICAVSLGRHHIESKESGCTTDEGGRVKFLFQDEGHCRIEQCGRITTLSAGQWCAIDKSRPFSVQACDASRQIALVVPKRRLAEGPSVSRQLVGPQGFLRGTGQVLHSSATASLCAASVIGRRDRIRLGDALVGLLNVAWHADPVTQSDKTTRGRRLAVIDFVERNLHDPDLDVEQIAQALGCAKRTLHKLFADDATTIGRLIWERRLERCRMDLLDPAQCARSITDVAHGWGFKDSQHFSRSFKARFGASPRDFRNAHLANRIGERAA